MSDAPPILTQRRIEAAFCAVLSCNRDGAFCEGYDPRLKLARSQTLIGWRHALRLPLPLLRTAGLSCER